MTEAFLHYVWRHQLVCSDRLCTTAGEPIQVLKIGTYNTNAGPDFLNAKIKIGETVWAGDVEIHLKSSDWDVHGHQQQTSYNSVILHAVNEFDKPAFTQNGSQIPTVVLPILPHVEQNFETLSNFHNDIKCSQSLVKIDPFRITIFMERLVAERFEEKSAHVMELFAQTNNDWRETLYQLLARNFGFKTNSDAFELLAKSLPLQILEKHRNDLQQIEALLLGQANLWTENPDKYEQALHKEYNFLQKKYGLQPISPTWWKFARMRPFNFPTVRIAQFAKLIYSSQSLTSKIWEADSIKTIEKLFNSATSEYWETHYILSKISPKHSTKIGQQAVQTILINCVVLFLFAYGRTRHDDAICQRAYDFLNQIPAEQNAIIQNWESCKIKPQSAYDSQALIQLFNKYCTQSRCIHCNIGHLVLNRQQE